MRGICMEKIKLSNGTIFEIIPMGITETEKRRSISFNSDLTYTEIEDNLRNTNNINCIQYISASDDVLVSYADCGALKKLSKDIDSGVYTAEFSTDAVERKLQELQEQINILKSLQGEV
jgi:hypothetical protein